jgi:hypothetical protein
MGYVPPSELEELFALAIDLKRRISVMIGVAVGFEDQSGFAPKKVGLEPTGPNIKGDVDLWPRQPCSLA